MSRLQQYQQCRPSVATTLQDLWNTFALAMTPDSGFIEREEVFRSCFGVVATDQSLSLADPCQFQHCCSYAMWVMYLFSPGAEGHLCWSGCSLPCTSWLVLRMVEYQCAQIDSDSAYVRQPQATMLLCSRSPQPHLFWQPYRWAVQDWPTSACLHEHGTQCASITHFASWSCRQEFVGHSCGTQL